VTAEIFRNRFFVPDKAPLRLKAVVRRAMAARAVEVKKWRLEDSIWAPREAWCDSKAFTDTTAVLRARFEAVWRRAVLFGLDKFVARSFLKAGKGRAGGSNGASELDDEGKLLSVFDVAMDFRPQLSSIFDYFMVLTGGFDGDISLNAYAQLVEDCGLASAELKFCKKSDLDRMYLTAAFASRKPDVQEVLERERTGFELNSKGELAEAEFLYCLVMVAHLRYVNEQDGTDITLPAAVSMLVERDLLPHLDAMATLDPNDFRVDTCYQEDVDTVLREHEADLRTIFAGLRLKRGPAKKLLAFPNWARFVRHVGLVGPEFSERDAAWCFACARMACADPYSYKGAMRSTHLPFEGFLEALVRAAIYKALPTDEDVALAGHADAASLLNEMQTSRPNEYEQLVAARSAASGPAQPAARCVHHVCCVAIRAIEAQFRGNEAWIAPIGLTDRACASFFKKGYQE